MSVEVECSEVLPITEIVRFATDLMAIARDKSLDIPPGAPQIVREED